jgi:hypothetical protein
VYTKSPDFLLLGDGKPETVKTKNGPRDDKIQGREHVRMESEEVNWGDRGRECKWTEHCRDSTT